MNRTALYTALRSKLLIGVTLYAIVMVTFIYHAEPPAMTTFWAAFYAALLINVGRYVYTRAKDRIADAADTVRAFPQADTARDRQAA